MRAIRLATLNNSHWLTQHFKLASTLITTHSGGTLPCQHESRFQTDIFYSHTIADPAELQLQRFLAFTDIFRNRFIRTNIHTTEGTEAVSQALLTPNESTTQELGPCTVPPTLIRNCLTINFAALSH